MKIKHVVKETFCICGYSVKTTLKQNNKDVSALYDDFFHNGKEAVMMNLRGSKKGYYGLSWYTQDHEQYCYLLGLRVAQESVPPQNAVLKKIPQAAYAVGCFPQGENIIKAWTEFFYNEIPKAGLKVDEKYNFYFEYYPDSVYGEFELWVPVMKADASASVLQGVLF